MYIGGPKLPGIFCGEGHGCAHIGRLNESRGEGKYPKGAETENPQKFPDRGNMFPRRRRRFLDKKTDEKAQKGGPCAQQKEDVHPCRLGDDGTHGKTDEGAAVVDHENGARGFFQPARPIIGGEKNGEGDPGGGGHPRDEVGDQKSGSRRPEIAQEGGNPHQQYANGDKGLMMALPVGKQPKGDADDHLGKAIDPDNDANCGCGQAHSRQIRRLIGDIDIERKPEQAGDQQQRQTFA